MNNAVNYILESGISLALLSIIYILFLRRETFFKLNRLFLLVSLIFSIILPFLKFRIYEPQPLMLAEVTVTPYRNLMEVVTVYGRDLSGTVEKTVSSSHILIIIYLAGLLFFMIRFALRFAQIFLLIIKNRIQISGQYKFVLLDKELSPFSFLKYIFINPSQREDEGYEKMISHEIEHVKQGHTFDVLVLEFMTILQWFNPFMWLLKKAIRENHEFLADSAVLNSGINPTLYKKLLLNQYIGFDLELANNFNTSLIGKRVKMISKIRSPKYANLKYALGILTVVGLLATFACEQDESIEMVLDTDKTDMRISFFGEKIRIEANNSDLNRLKQMFAGKSSFNLEADSLGNYFLVKNNTLLPRLLDKGEEIVSLADIMPEFPGGEDGLRNHIATAIQYPKEALDKEITGRVFVSFVVTKTGEVANCKVVRGVHESIDIEALRIMNSLPSWKPGVKNGQVVNVRYTVPIKFEIEHPENKKEPMPMEATESIIN
ncbi:M56 family metallopeptidase [Draconibacterium sp.]|nr:M56 family metallopeptidase [Draconibacterium sp.]